MASISRSSWRAFMVAGLVASLCLVSFVAAQDNAPNNQADNKVAAEQPETYTKIGDSDNSTTLYTVTEKPRTWRDWIFPLVCGLAGIPIFAFVIAAAVYQPFHTKQREEKKYREEQAERKKRSDSATEKFKILQKQISMAPGKEKEAEALRGAKMV